MAEKKDAKKKGGGYNSTLIDFDLNPCATLFVLFLLPPAMLTLWIVFR